MATEEKGGEILSVKSDLPDNRLNLIGLNTSMTEVDQRIREVVTLLGLPNDGIVQNVKERGRVFKNLEDVVDGITANKESMVYVSKFIYATANGLFDAALNYLWDATVNELRSRISDFDVEYFYDIAVTSTEKRIKLNGVGDLPKIQDADLLSGANKIELIDSVACHELNNIRYMRNWASSAHPTDVKLSGLSLIGWLEICINKVFNIPYSTLNLEIKKFLGDIKSRSFPDSEIDAKKVFFSKLSNNQANMLIKGLFGIYVSEKTTSETRANISKLIEPLWVIASDETKVKMGTNYGNYSINGHTEKATQARDFLEIVHGQAYIPDDLKVSEISNILSDLLSANDNVDNFYTEPSLSTQLVGFVDKYGALPSTIENEYIKTVVYCFLTNGNGIAWNADDNYRLMIQRFTVDQATKALLLYQDDRIYNKLRMTLCLNQFRELLSLIKPRIIQDKPRKLLDYLNDFKGTPFTNFVNDAAYKKNFKQYSDSFKSTVK